MNPTRFLAVAAIGVAALAATPVAKSSAVHWTLQAEVTEVQDPKNLLGGVLAIGDTLSGDVRFDDATPDSSPLPTVGRYGHDSAPWGIALHGGGLDFASDALQPNFWVQVVNDHNGLDGFSFIEYSLQPLANGNWVGYLFVELQDPTMSALSDTGIPSQPPQLGAFGGLRLVTIRGCSPQAEDGCTEFAVKAELQTIGVADDAPGSPLPLPSTAALATLAALGLRRRRAAAA